MAQYLLGDLRDHCIMTSRLKRPFLTHPPTLSCLISFRYTTNQRDVICYS